jgi:hypothetical protein
MKRIFIILSFLFVLFVSQANFAGSGLFFNVRAAGSPGNVNIILCLDGKGPLSCQQYNVSALNLSISTTVPNHSYPSIGIQVNTPGYTIANIGIACTMLSNGYCLFSASDTAPVGISLKQAATTGYSVGGTISGLTANGLVLQNNGGDNLTVNSNATLFQFSTPVVSGGSYNVTVQTQPIGLTCTVGNGSGTNVMANVTNPTVNCQQSGGYAYVSDASSNLWHCPMNTTTGGFNGACTALTNSPAFTESVGTTFNTFTATTYAYVSDNSSNLWRCPMNTTTGVFSGACTALTNSTSFNVTQSATFNTFAGTTYAYVSDNSSNLWQCPMNTTTGGFSGACTALTNSTSFLKTQSTTFNTFAGATYAYVGDNTSNLWRCPMNTSTGGFSGPCTALTNSTSFTATQIATFKTFAGTAYAYVSDISSNLWRCPMNTTTGGFSGACTALTGSFVASVNAAFNTFTGTTYAYVSEGTNNLWQCPVNTATGGFGGACTALTNPTSFTATQSATFSTF